MICGIEAPRAEIVLAASRIPSSMLRFADPDITGLLQSGDPHPVEWVNISGRSAIFLICEHAGRAVPSALGDLGIDPEEMDRHIAYDVGAEGLARGAFRAP